GRSSSSGFKNMSTNPSNIQPVVPLTSIQHYFLLAITAGTALLTFFIFQPFLASFLLAATARIIVYPVFKRLEKFFHSGVVASLVTVALLLIVILLPVTLLGFEAVREAIDMYTKASSGSGSITIFLDQLINLHIRPYLPFATLNATQYINNLSQWFIGNFGTFFSNTFGIGFKLFLALFASFYFLKDGRKFLSTLNTLSPLPDEHNASIAKVLRRTIMSVIVGSLVVAIVQGVLAGIGYSIFGVPSAALWGALTGIMSLVPGFGTSLVFVPIIVSLFFFGSKGAALGLAIWAALAVGMIDNFMVPKLIGRGINIHPLLTLFAILGGISFFGPEGFLLGPLVLSLFIALLDLSKGHGSSLA
ncbi:MAG: AI-2E family transporter, partial [Candidatus Pacebacteria bacterium]|nr:AI-2E family transporter [Candidatus Paceibacterota bacterium]